MTSRSTVRKALDRLSVLDLADSLGNVAEACRRHGVDRTSFYKWRRRYRAGGLESLTDPPVTPWRPRGKSQSVQAKVVAAALDHPTWGVARLSAHLGEEGIDLGHATAHRILKANGLSTPAGRLVCIEMAWRGHWGEAIAGQLRDDQLKAAESANPAFRERHRSGTRPGELLAHDTLFVGNLPGPTHLFLQVAIDTFSGLAFARFHRARGKNHAISLLHNRVIPFFTGWELRIEAIQTGRGTEFTGRRHHPYRLYLEAEGIQQRTLAASVGHRMNGHVAAFSQAVRRELVGWLNREIAGRPLRPDDGLPMQESLDVWLHLYNTERRLPGFPTWGSTRAETFHAITPQG